MKVVTSEEMARIEKLAYATGASELEFMEKAGAGVAACTEKFITSHHLEKRVTLLVGKGNNGGDALAAGKILVKQGFLVTAKMVFPEDACSPLSQQQCTAYKSAGGKFSDELAGVILDGLTGTGFRGKAEGALLQAIEEANASKLPILAIDIPSGVNGTTGEVGSSAIFATETLYLGLPKLGFFVQEGWNHVGKLKQVDFGLEQKFLDAATSGYMIPDIEQLPPIVRNRHKYEAGYVVAVAGSHGFSGAAFLACLATLRAGAGIVRLFFAEGMENELAGAPYEIVKEEIDPVRGYLRILEEGQRAKAFLIGPGMGRNPQTEKLLKNLLGRLEKPCVLDADALYFLAENPKWDLPEKAILTPHKKEAERLLGLSSPCSEQELHKLCQAYADERNITLLLKGAPTFIFHPRKAPSISTHGDPGMATAGTGDVLTGILAALLAQGMEPDAASRLGATLHGMAGELAASHMSSYSLIASDLIEALPDAFFCLQSSCER